MHFIDVMLMNYGLLNRAALMDYFGISVPQASADIKAYLAAAPGNMAYDQSAKAYRVCDTFQPWKWR